MNKFALITALLGFHASIAAIHAAKPNIILVLADDLGAKELSCYGSKEHFTPNLDRMAAEGTRFETFFAMPLCTPTRVCLMTGQYGHHNGFLGMADPAFKPLKNDPKTEMGNHFTHADLMKSAGYKTAQCGKWQLSGVLPTLVRDCGFDEYRMWAYDHNLPTGIKHLAHEKGDRGNASRYWQPCIIGNGEYLPTKPDDYGPDFFNDFAIDFARRHKTEPFFIYYTSVLTHGPHLETPDPAHPGRRWPAGFKSNLEYLDHLMGRLFSSLKSEGLDENTLVIFVGDNGTGGDGKGTVTELGARTPCIIRGPGVKRGVVSRAVADLTDIMPTLADYGGATLPKDVPFDGHSLAPVLRGEKETHREWIYSHLDDGRVLRDSRWLLEISKGGKGEKFFDCGESRDGTGYKDVTSSIDAEAKAARARFASILETMPEPKPHEGMGPKTGKKAANGNKPASEAPPASMKDKDARFAFRDKNKDGRIDHDEFVATASAKDSDANEARFKKLDADHDGGITKEEFLSEGKAGKE